MYYFYKRTIAFIDYQKQIYFEMNMVLTINK
jgi:hypothetical protein